MKMVLINYYVGLDAEVKEILDSLGICTYTRIPEAEGRISCGSPRESSHVWPGANSTLFAVVDDGMAAALMDKVVSYNADAQGEGFDAFVLNVERAVWADEESRGRKSRDD
jgi:hypothetical protein